MICSAKHEVSTAVQRGPRERGKEACGGGAHSRTCALAKGAQHDEVGVRLHPVHAAGHVAELNVRLVQHHQHRKRQHRADLRTCTRMHGDPCVSRKQRVVSETTFVMAPRYMLLLEGGKLSRTRAHLLLRHHGTVGVVGRREEDDLGLVLLHRPPATWGREPRPGARSRHSAHVSQPAPGPVLQTDQHGGAAA